MITMSNCASNYPYASNSIQAYGTATATGPIGSVETDVNDGIVTQRVTYEVLGVGRVTVNAAITSIEASMTRVSVGDEVYLWPLRNYLTSDSDSTTMRVNSCGTTTSASCYGNLVPLLPTERLRARIRANMGAAGASRCLNMVKRGDPEDNARGLLREMVGAEQFRNYVARGFVTVKGSSGIVYKLSQNGITSYARTKDGRYKKFENICVVFQKAMPPTDAVVMRLLLLRNDEFATRARANVTRHADEADFDLGHVLDLLPKQKPMQTIFGGLGFVGPIQGVMAGIGIQVMDELRPAEVA